MKLSCRVVTVLGMLAALRAWADCGPDNAQIKLGLPPQALTIRNALRAQLCADGQGPVIDITDSTLAGRFTAPGQIIYSQAIPNPTSRTGHLLLVVVLDVDGRIRQPTVLVSSGDKSWMSKR